jgi:hypothetical protein
VPVRSKTRAPAWNREPPPPPAPKGRPKGKETKLRPNKLAPHNVRGESLLHFVVWATNLAVHGTTVRNRVQPRSKIMRMRLKGALAVPLLRESAMAAGGHGRFPASSRENGGEGLGPAAVGGTERPSLGAVPLTAPRHMCSPLRGGTVDDTVLLGTICLLLATSVAVKEPKLWRKGTSPGRVPRGSILFSPGPLGEVPSCSESTQHQHQDAAEVEARVFAFTCSHPRPRPVLGAENRLTRQDSRHVLL